MLPFESSHSPGGKGLEIIENSEISLRCWRQLSSKGIIDQDEFSNELQPIKS